MYSWHICLVTKQILFRDSRKYLTVVSAVFQTTLPDIPPISGSLFFVTSVHAKVRNMRVPVFEFCHLAQASFVKYLAGRGFDPGTSGSNRQLGNVDLV